LIPTGIGIAGSIDDVKSGIELAKLEKSKLILTFSLVPRLKNNVGASLHSPLHYFDKH
jgi:hypothetical protein